MPCQRMRGGDKNCQTIFAGVVLVHAVPSWLPRDIASVPVFHWRSAFASNSQRLNPNAHDSQNFNHAEVGRAGSKTSNGQA